MRGSRHRNSSRCFPTIATHVVALRLWERRLGMSLSWDLRPRLLHIVPSALGMCCDYGSRFSTHGRPAVGWPLCRHWPWQPLAIVVMATNRESSNTGRRPSSLRQKPGHPYKLSEACNPWPFNFLSQWTTFPYPQTPREKPWVKRP